MELHDKTVNHKKGSRTRAGQSSVNKTEFFEYLRKSPLMKNKTVNFKIVNDTNLSFKKLTIKNEKETDGFLKTATFVLSFL